MSDTAGLITLVRQKWGQTAADSGGISDVDLVAYLNMRQAELCAETNILPTQWTGSLVGGQEEYSVPIAYHRVQAVYIYQTSGDNIKWRLTPVGILDRDATKTQGSPTSYFFWGGNLASGDATYILGLTPIPLNSGTNDLEVWARKIPKTMVKNGAGPDVNQEWQYAIVTGALVDVYTRLLASNSNYLVPLKLAQARWDELKEVAAEYIMPHTMDTPSQIRFEAYRR